MPKNARYSDGMSKAHMRYATQPKPGIMIANMRTIIGSMFKYSPSPPQTPAIHLLLRERYKRFVSIFYPLLCRITACFAGYPDLNNSRSKKANFSFKHIIT